MNNSEVKVISINIFDSYQFTNEDVKNLYMFNSDLDSIISRLKSNQTLDYSDIKRLEDINNFIYDIFVDLMH